MSIDLGREGWGALPYPLPKMHGSAVNHCAERMDAYRSAEQPASNAWLAAADQHK